MVLGANPKGLGFVNVDRQPVVDRQAVDQGGEERAGAHAAFLPRRLRQLICPPQPGSASGTVYRGWTKKGTLDGKAVIQRGADHPQAARGRRGVDRGDR